LDTSVAVAIVAWLGEAVVDDIVFVEFFVVFGVTTGREGCAVAHKKVGRHEVDRKTQMASFFEVGSPKCDVSRQERVKP
jgi:hypothetical protein